MENKKEIVTYMSIFPKEVEESAQLGGENPNVAVASPSHSIEKTIVKSVSDGSPPHITIDSESMQLDSIR